MVRAGSIVPDPLPSSIADRRADLVAWTKFNCLLRTPGTVFVERAGPAGDRAPMTGRECTFRPMISTEIGTLTKITITPHTDLCSGGARPGAHPKEGCRPDGGIQSTAKTTTTRYLPSSWWEIGQWPFVRTR